MYYAMARPCHPYIESLYIDSWIGRAKRALPCRLNGSRCHDIYIISYVVGARTDRLTAHAHRLYISYVRRRKEYDVNFTSTSKIPRKLSVYLEFTDSCTRRGSWGSRERERAPSLVNSQAGGVTI